MQNDTIYLLLKSVILLVSSPLTLCAIALGFGVIILWRSAGNTYGKTSLGIALLLLISTSTALIPDAFIDSLEQRHPPCRDSDISGKFRDVKVVVVLGGGISQNTELPLTSQFLPGSLVRAAEGIRLFFLVEKKHTDVKLILSGGGNHPTTSAELMLQYSLQVGVPLDAIRIEKESLTTYDEAILLKPMLGKERFYLVTSAGHMPRAMAIFNKAGMKPIAAPCDHRIKNRSSSFLTRLFPSSRNIENTELVVYEYMGLVKDSMAGHL